MNGKRVLIILSISILAVGILALTGILIYVMAVAAKANLDESKLSTSAQVVHFVDKTGASIDLAGGYVEIEEVPQDLAHAFVSVEDKRFYTHHGLDYRRMAAALVHNVQTRSFKEGASTISCQLIKNTHLTQEKTISRKIQEAKLALQLEKEYDKDEILEMYLNVIYLGTGIYGVGAAAQSLYGKPVEDLSLAECASIAAITVNPSLYNPRIAPDNNTKRRNVVLGLMLEQGYISEAAHDEACASPLLLAENDADIYETYRIAALDEASRLSGIDVKTLRQGYTIYTYCDPAAQRRAYEAIGSVDDADRMVLLTDDEAAVVAYCSSFALAPSAIRRQIGSTVKPFIYAAAIERDLLLPDTLLADEPQTFGDYAPHNYHDVYRGKISARSALAHSSNVAAVRTLGYAGIDATADLIERAGLPLSEEDRHLALALGGLTYGCTFDEVATAYSTLQNLGVRRNVALVRQIVDADGRTVYVREENGTRVLSRETAYIVSDMLRSAVTEGTAKKLGELSIPLSAKTGTVQAGDANSDAWCVAYTRDLLCVAWAGNLSMERDKMTEISGGGGTASLSKRMLSSAPNSAFAAPAGIAMREIETYTYDHDGTMVLASPNTPERYRRTVLTKTTTSMPTSTLFERCPATDAQWTAEGGEVRLTLDANPLCTYQVYLDNGYEKYAVDSFEAGGVCSRNYPMVAGWWSVKPILHGKTDVEGVEKTVMVL